MKNTFLVLFFIVVVLIGGCTSTRLSDDHKATDDYLEEQEKAFHIHADFKAYIDDKAVDFSVPMYQLRDKYVHVEDGVGELIHIHKKGITIGNFFETLDIGFNKTCLIIPMRGSYCNTDDKKLSFYVNGIENNEFDSYEIKDLDRILVSYGEGGIKDQLESVTDFASEK